MTRSSLAYASALALTVASGLAATVAGAQAAASSEPPNEVEQVPDFADLRTPDSAAFVLLGVSPTEIQRPTSPRQLAVTLRNAFAGNGRLGIPDAFALETSPFWLMRHDRLTLDDFVASSVPEQLWQNLSLSIATTTQIDPGATTNVAANHTLFGASARTHYEQRENTCQKAVDGRGQEILAIANQRYAEQMNQLTKQLAAAGVSDAEMSAALQAKHDQIDKEVAAEFSAEFDALAARCEGVVGAHDGIVFDLATALGLSFPDATIQRGDLSRFGVWGTFGYTGLHWSALALVRYQASDLELSDSYEVVDTGARLIGYMQRFAFSAELVGRFVVNPALDRSKAALWRATGAIDCHLGNGIWVNTTFGRDFDDSTHGSLIALLSLRADIGERSIQRPTLANTLQQQRSPTK